MSHPPNARVSALVTAAAGSMLVFGSLVWYQIALGTSSVIRTEDIGLLEETAYVTLGLVFVGLVLAFVSITRYLQQTSSRGHLRASSSSLTRLASITEDKRSVRLFVLSAFGYGLFFGVASSTLVFQPGSFFSEAYGARVPSIVPVVCCGTLGQMPQLVVYLTQQFAILVVPVNLVLLFTVSWLVGLNVALASYVYANRPVVAGGRWITGFGAIIGLFTVCPTCAGFFLMEILGLGGLVGLALTLSSLQAIFVVIGLPILLVTPILTLRHFPDLQKCTISKKPPERNN